LEEPRHLRLCGRASVQGRVMVDEGEKLALSTSVRRFHPHYLSSKAPTLYINRGWAVQDVAMTFGPGFLNFSSRAGPPSGVSP
jgi:hypothetical protein